MLSLPEAVASALSAFPRLGHERVSLASAFMRRAGAAICARQFFPPFDASAMDGYAVRFADLANASDANPMSLVRIGDSRAGVGAECVVGPGQAVRIFTGAPMASGADAVLMQEDAVVDGVNIRSSFAPTWMQHVRRMGSDLAPGDPLIRRSGVIRAGEIAVLASQDVATVDVFRRPTVAIISTGDELREVGEPNRPGSIVGTNAWMLAALVTREGGIPRVFPNVPDEPEAIAAVVKDALTCDVVLTTGGVSVGDHDYVPRVFVGLGIETVFAKVRMKPGKPVMVARRGDTPVVGLPGNPASALVSFELFVTPGLRWMQGDDTPFGGGTVLPLAADYARAPGRPELARGRLQYIEGRPSLELTTTQRSSALVSLLDVDRLALFAGDEACVTAGTRVFTMEIGAPGCLSTSPLADHPDLRAHGDV